MESKLRFALCGALAALAATFARAEYALAYHGKLVRTDGVAISTKVPMTMEFRLYQQQEPGETAPLWGRLAPVRFDATGAFYVELSDALGTAVSGASCTSLSEALIRAAGGDVYISVTPSGYGELLPRKRLGGVHRVERAEITTKATRLETALLKAETVVAADASVSGALTVKNSFLAGGGTIRNTVDGTKTVTLGSSNGSVLFTDAFSFWGEPGIGGISSWSHAGTDLLAAFGTDSGLGVFSIPAQAGASLSLPSTKFFKVQAFIDAYYNPFF